MPVVGHHHPPPFFKHGLSASARLAVYIALSLILLICDLRFGFLTPIRGAFSSIVYPLQEAAMVPGQFLDNSSNYLSNLSSLRQENLELKTAKIDSDRRVVRTMELEQENDRLRQLMQMQERVPVKTMAAEIVFSSSDPFSQRVILDKGSRQGVLAGLAVLDMKGMIGQITRVFPSHSEVTMLTDKNQAVPVLIERSGLRAVMFGTESGMLELRFLAANADVKEGDRVLTSGLDGILLPKLPIATVTKISTEGRASFAQVLCTPLGKTNTLGAVLVVGRAQPGQQYPDEATAQSDAVAAPAELPKPQAPVAASAPLPKPHSASRAAPAPPTETDAAATQPSAAQEATP